MVLVVIALSGVVGSAFSNNFNSGNSPSQRAQDLLALRFPAQAGDTAYVVIHTTGQVNDAANAATINRLVDALVPLPNVTSVRSPLSSGAEHQVSADGHTAFAVVQFDKTTPDLKTSHTKELIRVAKSFAHPGLAVSVGGNPISAAVSATPGSSEAIGILAAIIIMLVAFGSVVAMGLPILIAVVGVGIGYGLVNFASHGFTVPTFGPQLMALIGLGVGIDYALFIVTRYRQGLHEGRDPREATIVALTTSGRAVLFAGSTVIISLLGLFVVGLAFMNGLAVGTIAAVRHGPGRGLDVAAGHARLCRPQHRPPARARPAGALSDRWPGLLVPVEPDGAAPAVGVRDSRGGGACWPWPCRSFPCGWRSATLEMTRPS